MAKQGTEM